MKPCIIVFVISTICIYVNGNLHLSRHRRDVVGGTLDIISNNAKPIHADVKSEMTVTEQLPSRSTMCTFESTLQPCSTGYVPSQIEPGIVFQVTPPVTVFQQSGRKSLSAPSRLELVRSVSRLAAVVVLAFTALVELYPALVHLLNIIVSFMV